MIPVGPARSGIGFLLGVLPWVIVTSSSAGLTCPPLQSDTVQVRCKLGGEPFDCTSVRSEPGTVATFRCKLLHKFLFDYLPAGGYESHCEPSGEWSVQPFRCVPVCGQPTGKPTALIRGGRNVSSAQEYPWHVTIYDVHDGMGQVCGGTLISPKFFVSAAHCFHNNKRPQLPSRYRVAVGKTKRSAELDEPNAQFRELYAIHLADNYGTRKFHYQNDIALVEVAVEIDMTAWALPACVDWARDLPLLRDGEEGTVVGFGDRGGGIPSEILKAARLPFVRPDVCRARIYHTLAIFNILPDKFCVGFINRTRGTTVAKGDSGGGLVFPNEKGQWFLRGVVSVGDADASTFSFFTDVTTFIPWMSGVIRHGQVSGRQCGVDVDEAAVVDGEEAHREDFPWEVDIFLEENNNFKLLWTGVLVEPNMVVAPNGGRGPGAEPNRDVSAIPPERFRIVAPRNSSDLARAVYVNEVVRTYTPNDVAQELGFSYDVIVFELQRPLNLMPICFDWTGNALLQNKHNGTAIGTSLYRASITLDRPAWQRYGIVPGSDCSPIATWPIPLHKVCAREWNDDRQASRHETPSLAVNVDGAWYLRGVRVGLWDIQERWFFPLFTDMINPGVRQWMARTRDLIGKPTCGDVSLCEPLTSGSTLPGHLPWNVGVIATNTVSTRWGSGVLIQPNVVLTDFDNVGGGDNLELTWGERSKYPLPVKNITIAWTSKDGSSKTSNVFRVHLSTHSIGRLLDVAILELDPSTPILNTPVCVDLTGSIVPSPRSGQLGIMEIWEKWYPSNHTMLGITALDRTDCKSLVDRIGLGSSYVSSRMLCIRSRKYAYGYSSRGAGLLSRVGSKWYLQGILQNYRNLLTSSIAFAEDMRNEELRLWLGKRLSSIPKVQQSIGMTDAKECIGKRKPHAQCGVLISRNEYGEYGFNDFEKYSFIHMDWQVRVKISDPLYKWGWLGSSDFSGVLVHPTLVLTSASGVVAETRANGTERFITATNVLVEYTTSKYITVDDTADDGYKSITSEVVRIHLRERTAGQRGDMRVDLALLELKNPVPLMPVCVPPPGAVGRTLPALAPGTRGMTEEHRARHHGREQRLIPTAYRSRGDCEVMLSEREGAVVGEDEFCAEPLSGGERTHYASGAPYVVFLDGKWYLRGVLHSDFNSELHMPSVYSFHDLDNNDALVWIDERIQAASKGGSDASTPWVLPGLPPISLPRNVPVPSECGFHLAVDEHGKYARDESLLEKSRFGHLDWHISIQAVTGSSVSVFKGVLIHPRLVLISTSSIANETLLEKMGEDEIDLISAENFTINFNVKVDRIHVRNNSDVALLELKSMMGQMPVCIHSPGAVGTTVPRLTPGTRGLIESYDSTKEIIPTAYLAELVPAVYRGQGALIEGDHPRRRIFLAEPQHDGSRVVWPGTAYAVLTRGKWFLRGVLHDDGSGGADGRITYAFHDLDDDEVLAWLDRMIRAVTSNGDTRKPGAHPES